MPQIRNEDALLRYISDRLLAVQILVELLYQNGSLSSHLSGLSAANPTVNLPLVQEYTYGVCRWYPRLAFIAQRLMEKPARTKDNDIFCLILLGLYQLFHMRTPDHAAVNETVATTRILKKPWAKNLVNAVLRQALREREALQAAIQDEPLARFAHPPWLMGAIRQDWPEQADSVLDNNNRQAPMVLRANLHRSSRDQCLERLAASGITASAGANTATGIALAAPCEVGKLPGFADGLLSVQDEASQLAAALLGPAPGALVLDACAAPGGKTCALLELADGNLDLLALDNNEDRLGKVRENLARTGLEAEVSCADAADTGQWWDGNPFDAILLDAPCSGTGVIRRHPDIKLLRHADDIPRLAGLQQQLLAALWPCLKPGGRLLYTTCSVLRAENERVVGDFLSTTGDATALPLSHPGTLPCNPGMQFLPGAAGTDGFYYALLEKH